MTSTQAGAGAQLALSRSAMYALLGRALAYPGHGQSTALDELVPALAALPAALGAEAMLLLEALPLRGEREVAYQRLFTHSSSRDCPTFETAFSAKEIFQQTQQLADIGGFYRAFGVQPIAGTERPDHIC